MIDDILMYMSNRYPVIIEREKEQWKDIKDNIIPLLNNIETTPFQPLDIISYLRRGISPSDIQDYILPLLETISYDAIIMLTSVNPVHRRYFPYNETVDATFTPLNIHTIRGYLPSILEKIPVHKLLDFAGFSSLQDVHQYILPLLNAFTQEEIIQYLLHGTSTNSSLNFCRNDEMT